MNVRSSIFLLAVFLLLVSFMFTSCVTTRPPEGESDVQAGLSICRALLAKEIATRQALDANPAAQYQLAPPSQIEADYAVLSRCVEYWISPCDPIQAVFLRRGEQLSHDYTLSSRGEKGRPMTGTLSQGIQVYHDQRTVQNVLRSREEAAVAASARKDHVASSSDEDESSSTEAVGGSIATTEEAPVETPPTPAAAETPPAPAPTPAASVAPSPSKVRELPPMKPRS